MMGNGLLSQILFIIRALVIGAPDVSPWSRFLLWIVRLVTFALLLRTYVVPNVLRIFSKNLRIKSVSLRSIRGIYIRAGAKTWHIDRIRWSYHRPSADMASRISIRIEGLKVEIGEAPPEKPSARPRTSPLWTQHAQIVACYRVRAALFWLYVALEPYLRPVFRLIFVTALRSMIRVVPPLTQVADFELSEAVVTFTALSGISFVLRGATLRTQAAFTQLEQVFSVGKDTKDPAAKLRRRHSRFKSVIDWKDRVTSSVERTWEKAWGQTRGTVSLALTVNHLAAFSRPWPTAMLLSLSAMDGLPLGAIFNIPGAINLKASVSFSPKQAIIEPHSFETSLNLETMHIAVDAVRDLMTRLKKTKKQDDVVSASVRLRSASQLQSRSLRPTRAPWRDSLATAAFLRRRPKPTVVQRLKRAKPSTWLSKLKSIEFRIDAINLHYDDDDTGSTEHYRAVSHDISFKARLSDPRKNPLHRDWLGKGPESASMIDPDVYAFAFSIDETSVHRRTERDAADDLCLLSSGFFEAQILITQWPPPGGVSYISGDPNGPLLVTRVTLPKLEVQYRFEDLKQLLAKEKHPKPPAEPSFGPRTLAPVPRFIVEVQVGSLRARLLDVPGNAVDETFNLEIRNDGLSATAASHFVSLTDDGDDNDGARVRMDSSFFLVSRPTFLSLRSTDITEDQRRYSRLGGIPNPTSDPILSLASVELSGIGNSLGEVTTDSGTILFLDSAYLETHCSAEYVSVELWQPNVLTVLSELVDAVSQKKSPQSSATNEPLFKRLPFGLSLSFAVERLIVSILGRDINTDNDLDLARGMSLATGISAKYCALRPQHLWRFKGPPVESQTRQKLYLPEELVSQAVSNARTSQMTGDASAFANLHVWDTAVRSAVATPYEIADDSSATEGDSSFFSEREFLYIPSVQMDVQLAEKVDTSIGSCHIKTQMPYVRAAFQLGHVYSLLLALQALQALKPRREAASLTQTPSLPIDVSAEGIIETCQIVWSLRKKEKLYSRLDSFNVNMSSTRSISIHWDALLLCVPDPKNDDVDGQWVELGLVQSWNGLLYQPTEGQWTVSLDGQFARLRIPFEYVLADLIQDISITVKALKHLTRITKAGMYIPMEYPEAEEAKCVPNLELNLGCLMVEAADDLFETKLSLISRAGFLAAKVRESREEAFELKADAIRSVETSHQTVARDAESGFEFTPNHSVSIEDARSRLLQVHSMDWLQRHSQFKESVLHQEQLIFSRFQLERTLEASEIPNLVPIADNGGMPPLLRAALHQVSLTIGPPSFPHADLPGFLHRQGGGLPVDTQYSLLVPLHLNLTLASAKVSIRDYPLPLLYIPSRGEETLPVLQFDTDLVVAEEMGTSLSVDWFDCVVLPPDTGVSGANPLSIRVPKAIMPVKTYANPMLHVRNERPTEFSWGVSYGAAVQDLMRIIDTITSAPRDPSPAVGFWDKLRLSFHWQIKAQFDGGVHLHVKGSRDPYFIANHGAGFVLCWQGKPSLTIGLPNEHNELVQVEADEMSIVIPNLQTNDDVAQGMLSDSQESPRFRKVCAKLSSGVRFGVGIVLERSCGSSCQTCKGIPFRRTCRFFDFKPHFEVKLERKAEPPKPHHPEDSYNEFRSDFIHMSISLTSGTRSGGEGNIGFSSLRLTPKTFTHFWSWWTLFDSTMSLPIRQGGLYNHKRPLSPKFGRHLSTLKYRISVDRLFIYHAYVDDSTESWADGTTSFVGLKALIGQFHADMHQREEEMAVSVPNADSDAIHTHKPFYALEVVMKNLELRAMSATFQEPLKRAVPMESTQQGSRFKAKDKTPNGPPLGEWFDPSDFVETDWAPSGTPQVHLLPIVACPRFTYFKTPRERRPGGSRTSLNLSKFGEEDTHVCFLGKEPSVTQIQIDLATTRIEQLQKEFSQYEDFEKMSSTNQTIKKIDTHRKMISLLEDYVAQLRDVDVAVKTPDAKSDTAYYMPADFASAEDWAEFDNVYQVHSPQIFMSNSTRDILLQYYYCSRSRRGFEYHMATRAVKYLRDQANLAIPSGHDDEKSKPKKAAAAAAHALRKIITGDDDSGAFFEFAERPSRVIDPLSGWTDGVSLVKGHFCLLLKPQILLRSEASPDAICVLAAVQAKLQSFGIMDDANADDPVSGNVMTRTYASLSGLQTFSPSAQSGSVDGCIPLEVLIDFRCESDDFDRLVPQTDATFQYDKFNRLRLRNKVTSVVPASGHSNDHLQHQTDLVQIHVPQFTVQAGDKHFQAVSTIVTDLILFTDAAHKTRLDRLETLLFSYDFTDLRAAANVVADLQSRLRHVIETERTVGSRLRLMGDEGMTEMLKIKAHILRLADELNLIFDAIKLAQDKADDHPDNKSALLLHTLSSEISWRMLDDGNDLLAKVSLRKIDYSWLSRQDSSTENTLVVGDLQAFDGSPNAVWTEIISKQDDLPNHPLVKQGLFLLAHWIVLPPVGGITIYEDFELKLHPMRLQLDAKVGRRIMEYVWPARRDRPSVESSSRKSSEDSDSDNGDLSLPVTQAPTRSSMDTPRRRSVDNKLAPPLRRLGASRSFTDLRSAASDSTQRPRLERAQSSDVTRPNAPPPTRTDSRNDVLSLASANKGAGDAVEMKNRSSQKTFVRVKVDSLHLLLSIQKEGSFLCRDARIRTRELLYRNQTWSFEELVDQFIPSDPSWKGWVRMAFQQPLVPVLPVARELISKTQWIASKTKSQLDGDTSPGGFLKSPEEHAPRPSSSSSRKANSRRLRKISQRPLDDPANITHSPLSAEPESFDDSEQDVGVREAVHNRRLPGGPKMLRMFTRHASNSSSRRRNSMDAKPSGIPTSEHLDPPVSPRRGHSVDNRRR